MADFRTLQLFRKGKYPQGEISDEVISQIKKNYGKIKQIPIGIGHSRYYWNDHLPREGYIDASKKYGVDRKGNFTSAGVVLFPELENDYIAGKYNSWSVVIARPWVYDKKEKEWKAGEYYLHALDFLGRAHPAIKDLRDLTDVKNKPKYSEDELHTEMEFSNTPRQENQYPYKDEENHNFMHYSDSKKVEFLFYSYEFEEIDETENNSFSEVEMDELKKLQAQLEEMKANFSKQLETLNEQNAAFAKENADLKAKQELHIANYKQTQRQILDNEISSLPKEMKENLYKVLEELNVEFKVDGKSAYQVFSDCFKQLSFTANNPYTSDAPDLTNGDDVNAYNDPENVDKIMNF